jgi:lipid-A-disaccharide synthase
LKLEAGGPRSGPTILIVAGEASGDLHGAGLARAIQEQAPGAALLGAGGDKMRAAGVELVAETTKHAAVGIVEAFHNLHHYSKLYRTLQSVLKRRRPDVVVLIDFPDFNLRFAERVKDHGIPIAYYISPQIWAWRAGRMKDIKRLVTKMIVIFDFEEKLYRDAGVDAVFVGNPLLDHLPAPDREAARREFGGKPLIGLLPGSRRKSFAALYPLMLKSAELIAKELPDARFVVACARGLDPKAAKAKAEKARAAVQVVWDRTPEVQAASDLLLTASGTSTLEAALHGTPMIVTYKLNPLTVMTLGPLIRTRTFALVNIVAGREIMPEYYQSKAKPSLLAREALSILKDGRLESMRADLADVRRRLGSPGASQRAAREVLNVNLQRVR